jgi:hypothetical protein
MTSNGSSLKKKSLRVIPEIRRFSATSSGALLRHVITPDRIQVCAVNEYLERSRSPRANISTDFNAIVGVP